MSPRLIRPNSTTYHDRYAWYFLRVTTPRSSLAQSQVWMVHARSRVAAERRLDQALAQHGRGKLTQAELERLACYPAKPVNATIKQLHLLKSLGKGRDYFFTARGPVVPKPQLIRVNDSPIQGPPAPSLPNGANHGDPHADSQGATEAGR